MHRLASLPGVQEADGAVALVEQAGAAILFLTAAESDLLSLSRALDQRSAAGAGTARPFPAVRGLNLRALRHPASIDHYLHVTVARARLVLVRLLGGRGSWSYGLERLLVWSRGGGRHLLVMDGAGPDPHLESLSTTTPAYTGKVAAALAMGGPCNMAAVLSSLEWLVGEGRETAPTPVPIEDPLLHDWRDEGGTPVGVLFYRALAQCGDLAVVDGLIAALRGQGLAPKALLVSGLRQAPLQDAVQRLWRREAVAAVVCGTGFATVDLSLAEAGAPLWDSLAVPVLQLICSSQSREHWLRSSVGLGPVDLTMQVALPELDGRLLGRVVGFRELQGEDSRLQTALHRSVPDQQRLHWTARHLHSWINLRRTPRQRRRIALVLANYPSRNGRLANGVGLDTPASAAAVLGWLRQAGYGLGADLPADGDELINALLRGQTNDPESHQLRPLTHLPLQAYLRWYNALSPGFRAGLERHWGAAEQDRELEPEGFPIRGLRFAEVVLLLQPSRGYERDPALSYHSPDLPPTHHYLATYHWLQRSFGAHAVVHLGKHGNLEWLPGKGVGLSCDCGPDVVLQPLPHLYPFIVNDPGEGTQAKRRSQAVIVDHLTPPLGRAGLHGQEAVLEQLLDEYWEAQQLGSSRVQPLRAQLRQLLVKLHLTDQPGDTARAAEADPEAWLDGRLNAADGYLCELKEAQIRLGLHRLGSRPEPRLEGELLLALARAPGPGRQGLTQALADDLQLSLDPWRDGLDQPLDSTDLERLRQSGLWSDEHLPGGHGARLGDAIALLEAWCLDQLQSLLDVGSTSTSTSSGSGDSASSDSVAAAHVIGCGPATQRCLEQVRQHLLPRLTACAEREREALMGGLDGGRIAAGPAGAPTRGRPDVLPTGRNFYSVDPRGLPTETAWALGCKAADQLLERHLQDEGEPLRHLALSVWGTATMRNGGDEVAQCLALMGVRPLWDGVSRRVHDLEVIPQHQLGRPRLRITLRISGFFRDAFPSLIQLLGKADRLVHQASLLEHDASASGTTAALASASAPGCETEQAAAEGLLRIYGSAPGAYGAGLQGLIESGAWEESADLATAFLHWSGWRYGSDGSGGVVVAADREGLERRLGDVDAVLHNQDNREHDLLDSDDYYQFQGGLTAAVTTLRGERPATWFGDHSRPDQPRVHGLRRELDKVIRSRLLNPRWLEGMQRHGYKGGFELAASLDYLFAYDATTAMVPDWVYGAITEHWLRNPAVRQFLEQKNPWALRDMGERLLEAHHRGLWDGADDSAIGLLQQLVRDSDALLEQGGGKANGGGSADH